MNEPCSRYYASNEIGASFGSDNQIHGDLSDGFDSSPFISLLGASLVIVATVLALILVVGFGIVPKMVFRGEPKFRDEYSLTFSGNSIHFQTAHINSQLEWSMYRRALVDAHSFVLYHGSRSFTVIPKHAFETPEQLANFERLITEKIPEISRRDI